MAVMFTSQGVGYIGGYGTSFDSDEISDGGGIKSLDSGDTQGALDFASALAADARSNDLLVPHCICDKFPSNPSGLGPEWQPDPTHQHPGGQRFRRADGWGLDFHKGKSGKGRRAKGGKDHWHLVKPGETRTDEQKFFPGQDIPIPNSPFTLPVPDGLQGLPDPARALPPGYVDPCAGCDPVPAGPRPFFMPIPGPGTTIPSPQPVLMPEPVFVG